jgi:hypothetical protein
LNLFQRSMALVRQLGERAAEVVRRQSRYTNLHAVLDHCVHDVLWQQWTADRL